jgi:hypothetical protein
MKKLTEQPPAQIPHRRKTTYSLFGSIPALAAALVLLGGQFNARAQWDNFDDGDDLTPPVAWTHVDPINTASGGTSDPNTYDASSGKYHLIAPASSSLLSLGKARTLSLPTAANYDYTNFYVSVDVVSWDVNTVQAFGLVARTSDLGPATTDGYAFGLACGGAILSGQNYIQILRFENESTQDVFGSGPTGKAQMLIPDLDPAKVYRMVFMGRGTDLEGRLYELPNVTTPIAVVQGNTAADPIIITNGYCGLIAFGAIAGMGADVTFDNYYASKRVPLKITDMVVKDNFNDGNDTSPVAWTHYDPIYLAGQGQLPHQNTWLFPNGAYELKADASPDAGTLGPARVGSIDSATVLTDFRVAVDIVNYDPSLDMALGFLTRAHNIGPGSTAAHALTFQTRPSYHDIDLIRVNNESPDPAAGGENFKVDANDDTKPIDWSTNTMRLVFTGQGNVLRGLVFKLPETMNPLVDCVAVDTNLPAYTSGTTALFGFDNSSGSAMAVDVTFDNYSDTPIAAPAISVALGSVPGGEVTITWPGNNDGLWVLQSSSSIDPAAAWTEVVTTTAAGATGKILFDPVTGKNTFTGTAVMSSTGNTFYRLKQL